MFISILLQRITIISQPPRAGCWYSTLILAYALRCLINMHVSDGGVS